MAATPPPPQISKRRLGYFVWGAAALVITVPEIAASNLLGSGKDVFPWTTISHMVGHLERHHYWVELIVVAIIVLAAFTTTRVPPQPNPARDEPRDDNQPDRTPGGRLTLQTPDKPPNEGAKDFDDERAVRWLIAVLVAVVLVAGGTAVAVKWWDDKQHFQPAYILYGLLGLFFIIIPSGVALLKGAEGFPTLWRTVKNLEEWLERRRLPYKLGPFLAWLVSYAILAGLVILLLHLAFYPYPDITHIINPDG